MVLAALVCLRLSWWQWERTHDPDGTVQNLGYAILWPIFGVSFIYMWIRFLKLEVDRDSADDAEVAEFAAQVDAEFDSQFDPHPDIRSESPVERLTDAPPIDVPDDEADITPRPKRRTREPNGAVTLSVATVDPNDEDDPEMAAYNRALAELAEKDQRRAV